MAAKRHRRSAGAVAVRAWRLGQEPKVTQDDLGRRLGKKDGSLIHQYEAGRRELTVPVCIALAKLTGIPFDSLISRRQRRELDQAHDLIDAERKAG
ncbi:MAG: helix-turn-helix domain-containing protein [Myxococcota bacterium]